MLIPKIKFKEPLETECQHFLDCIKTGKMSLTGGAEALNVVTVLEACQSSLNCGGNTVEVRYLSSK